MRCKIFWKFFFFGIQLRVLNIEVWVTLFFYHVNYVIFNVIKVKVIKLKLAILYYLQYIFLLHYLVEDLNLQCKIPIGIISTGIISRENVRIENSTRLVTFN